MFYVNGELVDYRYKVLDNKVEILDVKLRDNPVAEWIANGIEEIKKHLPMTIEFPNLLGQKNGSGIMEYPQSRPLQIEETVTKFGYVFTFRYSERASIQTKDKVTYFPSRAVKFGAAYGGYNGSFVLNEDKIELAFFLKEVSKQRNIDFIIRDEVANATSNINAIKRQSALYSILPDMPNSMPDDKIKILAEAYGIGNVDYILEKHGKEAGMVIVRSRLYENVVALDKRNKNAIDEFVKRTEIDEITKMLSLVYRAINKRIIALHDTRDGKYWKTTSGESVCQSTGINHEEFLAGFLHKNKTKRDFIMELMGDNPKKELEGELTFEEDDDVDDIKALREQYKQKFDKEVPPKFIKNAEWIKEKLQN